MPASKPLVPITADLLNCPLSLRLVAGLGLDVAMTSAREPFVCYLPTQVVVKHPDQPFTMSVARAYKTDWFLRDGKPITYADLALKSDFEGLPGENELLLAEAWEDIGREGHVHYRLKYWILMSQREWLEQAKDIKSIHFPKLAGQKEPFE